MYSSRMQTVHSSSHVYPSMHWAGGCLPRGVFAHWEDLPRVVSAQGDVCPRVCLPGGCVSKHALGQTPPPPGEQNDRQV